MYLPTPEGVRLLEKEGLKKILDKEFPELQSDYLRMHLYDEDIEEYAEENNLNDLLEKIELGSSLDRSESFVMHSGIITNLLKSKLPNKINQEVKNTISAYWIYWDKFIKNNYSKEYSWRDEKSVNKIESDVHGDMIIWQYGLKDSEKDLFGDRKLVLKTEAKIIDGYYDYWILSLVHFMSFCCQTKKPIPFKDSWKELFYNGNFKASEPGSVSKEIIQSLKYFKEKQEFGNVEVLPFTDAPLKHMNVDKRFYLASPVMSSGGFESQPFIDKKELVYMHKCENGIELRREFWGNPSIRYDYSQVKEAIKGIMHCILKGGSRNMSEDPGLVFQYFPEERFKEVV